MAQFDLSITLEYGLIGSDDKDTFVEVVNEWISQGWQPLGGAFAYEGDLCQAMVREIPGQRHYADPAQDLRELHGIGK